ncbi:MAG: leucine--tRNA ligase [Armatimonas sp.]
MGRSEGAEVDFKVGSDTITVFTTRPDTLWGATFMVLSPEHPLVAKITTPERREAVENYIDEAASKSDEDRTAEGKEKTGVFTGAYATNPVNGKQIPIWIADYVLMGYGTGAIMAVPAHDQRDFEFARKFSLPIVLVYAEPDTPNEEDLTEAFATGGTFRATLHSPFSGEPQDKSVIVPKVVAWLEAQGTGRGKIQYRLRDWLISRQRYWGTPIPIIHCPICGIVPVPEDNLPVVLPDIEEYKPGPDGRSPLSTVPEFVNCFCPKCGGTAERETDTMAGAMDSSWYFLRFTDPHNDKAPFDTNIANYWMPIDTYIGGREHAVGHLLYCRFFTHFLHDLGLCAADEPAAALRNQGMLNAYTPVVQTNDGPKAVKPEEFVHYPREEWIARFDTDRKPIPAERYVEIDGVKTTEPIEITFAWLKMSKSKRTAVTPDEMAEKYGADALRLYILFEAPFEADIQWSEERMNGTFRFLGRVWDIVTSIVEAPPAPGTHETLPGAVAGDLPDNWAPMPEEDVRGLRRKTHQTIAKVTDDLENFRFNTSVSALMILTDTLRKFVNAGGSGHPAAREAAEALTLLLAPLAPHIAEELWARLGGEPFLYRTEWPASNPELAANDEVTVVIQINGKLRDKLVMPAAADKTDLENAALNSEKIISDLTGLTVRKIITVPGKLVNIVAN